MRQKLLACVLISLSLFITGCGDSDSGAASGKWVGEIYAHANSESSEVIGEFESYDKCVHATQKKSKSGIFNCGVKL